MYANSSMKKPFRPDLQHSLLDARLDRRLSLRKNRLQNMLEQKRSSQIFLTIKNSLSEMYNTINAVNCDRECIFKYIKNLPDKEKEEDILFNVMMIRKFCQETLDEQKLSELNGQGLCKELVNLFSRENIINNPLFVYEIFWIFINITSYTKKSSIAIYLYKRGIIGIIKRIITKEFIHTDNLASVISEFLRNFANELPKEYQQIFIDEKIIMFQIEQYKINHYSPKTKLDIIVSIISMIYKADTPNTIEERILYELCVQEVNCGFQQLQNKGFIVEQGDDYQKFIKSILVLSRLMDKNFNLFVRLNEINIFNMFAQILLNWKDINNYVVQDAILRVFSSLSTRNNNEYSLFLLRNGLLNLYTELLRSPLYQRNAILLEEILFAIGNFESAADQRNELNLMEFFNNKPFLEALFSLDLKSLLPTVKNKYFQCVCTLTLTPNTEDIFFLIDHGIILNFVELFRDTETNYKEQNFVYATEALIQIYSYTHYTEEQRQLLIAIAEQSGLLAYVESGILSMKSNILLEEFAQLERFIKIQKGEMILE